MRSERVKSVAGPSVALQGLTLYGIPTNSHVTSTAALGTVPM
jgi:hypothetical protein